MKSEDAVRVSAPHYFCRLHDGLNVSTALNMTVDRAYYNFRQVCRLFLSFRGTARLHLQSGCAVESSWVLADDYFLPHLHSIHQILRRYAPLNDSKPQHFSTLKKGADGKMPSAPFF